MNNRKEHYNKKGLYVGYDKNHKEREKNDYYSTPKEEVLNILNTIKIDFENSIILEPCCGGGHMIESIIKYLEDNNVSAGLCATDISDRGYKNDKINFLEYNLDFLKDEYIEKIPTDIDYIIMNPPYSLIEPFVMKSLGIAKKGMLMLGRLQFLEGQSRYENIFNDYPPTDIYVYVDRISCYKNGNDKEKMSSAQAYAWFYWDLENTDKKSEIHWIRRNDKIEK